MRKVRITLVIILILGLLVGGGYYWKWQTLHNVTVVTEPTENQNSMTAINKDKGRKNILVLGTDNRGNEIGRSDSIMLVSLNVDTHQVSVISIPRDTRVNIAGVGLTKITHANAVGEAKGGVREGTLESAKAVSNLLGVTINYYVKIDFQGFQKAVDAVGGININLPYPVNDNVAKVYLPAGENHLSGEEALRLARARYGLPNGDFDRQQDQFLLISALAHQMLNLSNITKLPEILNVVYQDLMDTNLSTAEIVTMGLEFKGLAKENIKYYQLPGRGITAYDPLVGDNVYYYEPDMDGLNKVVKEALAG
jgi:cell envelope-related function transcriptional attenuator common domain